MAANRRLNAEYKKWTEEKVDWGTVNIPDEGNVLKWKATITGPEGTPYEGGVFTLDITIPSEYPFKAPEIIFDTKVYHPNINPENGQFCAEVLRARWSPQLTIRNVLETLRNLLSDPNLDSPLNAQAGNDLKNNKAKFEKTAKEWTKKYAK